MNRNQEILQQRYRLMNVSSKSVAVSGNNFKHMPKWLFL